MGRAFLVVGVLFLGFIAFVSSIGVMQSHSIQYIFNVEFTQRVVGSLIALIGALGILWDWREEGPLSRFGSSTMVLLAGVSLSTSSWGACLALAAIVISSRFPFRGDSAEPAARPRTPLSPEEETPKWLDR